MYSMEPSYKNTCYKVSYKVEKSEMPRCSILTSSTGHVYSQWNIHLLQLSSKGKGCNSVDRYSAGTYKTLGSILMLPKQCVLEEYFITKQRTRLNIAKRQKKNNNAQTT